MSLYYQRKNNNPYKLPENVYKKVIYTIRDYDRLKERKEKLLCGSFQPDGMPKGGQVCESTFKKVRIREKIDEQLKAVDQAIGSMEAVFRKGLLDNIKQQSGFPLVYGSASTWSRKKAEFIYKVAAYLDEI